MHAIEMGQQTIEHLDGYIELRLDYTPLWFVAAGCPDPSFNGALTRFENNRGTTACQSPLSDPILNLCDCRLSRRLDRGGNVSSEFFGALECATNTNQFEFPGCDLSGRFARQPRGCESAFVADQHSTKDWRGALLPHWRRADCRCAVAGNISQLGADVTRRNLNIQPTIKVPVGYRFNVRVNRDMLFELPYRPVAG